jgi:hypothetical protein
MKLEFIIDEDYLLSHTLNKAGTSDPEIVALQNLAWFKSKTLYNFLAGRLYVPGSEINKLIKDLPEFIEEVKSSKEFEVIKSQVQEYLKWCEKEWLQKSKYTTKYMESITGLRFAKDHKVYITHPKLNNGMNHGDGVISWGHPEDWPNYTIVYIWHEILHSYLGHSEAEHAVIELITDNELRAHLNNVAYPPLIGHDHLKKIRARLLPEWRKYLKSEEKDIIKWIKSLDLTT